MSASDSIYALSSGSGRAGVAVMRVSGPGSRVALERLCGFVPRERFMSLVELSDAHQGFLDRGLAVFFPGPRSFTGEDCAELHVHGGRAVIAAIEAALGAIEGLRPAEAGEFAQRAFNNGKLDLTAAEGLVDLIEAETEAQRRAVARLSVGEGDRLLEELGRRLMAIRTEVEARIDFSDEGDVYDSGSERLRRALDSLLGTVRGLIDTGLRGRKVRDGLVVAIAGAPNVGKSSLLNWLAGRDAAIVSDEPGTTRDIIEIVLDLGGVSVRVFDTAGLRDAVGVEAEGVRRARALFAQCDLVIGLVDAGGSAAVDILLDKSGDNLPQPEFWTYRSRVDLMDANATVSDGLSTTTGHGLDSLLERLTRFAEGFADLGPVSFSRDRQLQELRLVASSMNDAMSRLVDESFDLAAEDLRRAGDALGRLTGRVHAEDVLGSIFSSFCIGK
ncbi:tRNA uridine-5-carboxymethylaminomethyl(34) synthesis GTPase MnmE [Tepidamorphus sp. 3E244]|uniref:tRNA uridine-5-carboxymethylaminomethyl(34) synthesis GTPase MnmE n=1 Tax=Tepidamorphus sp. 3E244 TaxID=3385498 RepID=UPI0038FD14F6